MSHTTLSDFTMVELARLDASIFQVHQLDYGFEHRVITAEQLEPSAPATSPVC